MAQIGDDERRVRVLYLDWNQIPKLFGHFPRGEDHYIDLPLLDGVPKGAAIKQIWFDHSRKALGILVQHQSFEVVPANAEPPAASASLAQVSIRVNIPE
jgi:hypothetical protein